jgi:hypothetical protein
VSQLCISNEAVMGLRDADLNLLIDNIKVRVTATNVHARHHT